jgi:ATP-dependent DNA helicase RecG
VHGKLTPEAKEAVMRDFYEGKIQVLIGTTVIEVGVDVPNATIMMIENAERFGLSQLHQLRGRVGRGIHKSFCFLFANINSAITEERLKIMEETTNGFIIAQADLRLRGPGEFMGTKQSGISDFGLESLASHGFLLEQAKQAAEDYLQTDPELNDLPEPFKQRLHKLKEKANLITGG